MRHSLPLIFIVLLTCSCGEPPSTDTPQHTDEVLVAETTTVRQSLERTQRVFVNFDGPRVDDCENYCSNPDANRTWVIGSHFGRTSVDFAPWGSGPQRQYVLDRLREHFSAYDVEILTRRPTAGPYQMLVISGSNAGPNHGVAPLDCDNSNPDDIAFVYDVASTSHDWVARAAAHELGHSFGLAHVTNSGDLMHWNASGYSFTRARWDSGRSSANCFDGDTQDAPAMLRAALGDRGRSHPEICDGVERLAGRTRHATAVEVSRWLFPHGSDAAVLVRDSDENPDALAAGPLAVRRGAPILLTPSNSLADQTHEELRRLDPTTVYIVGGEAAVSRSIASTLRNEGRTVVRLAGGSRWDTAAEVARSVGAPEGLAFVASGEAGHLVDALAVSGVAGASNAPILLVTRDEIPAATAAVLDDLDIDRTVVVGGPASVSDGLMAQLPSPRRLSGPTRYDTARAVADWAREQGVESGHAFIARGDLGPDALAGAAAGGVTLLTPSGALHSSAQDFLRAGTVSATLLGGAGALSDDVEYAVCETL